MHIQCSAVLKASVVLEMGMHVRGDEINKLLTNLYPVLCFASIPMSKRRFREFVETNGPECVNYGDLTKQSMVSRELCSETSGY